MVHAIGLATFTIYFTFIFTNKVTGALFGMVISFFLTNLYWYLKSSINLKFIFDVSIAKKIFFIGLPIITIGFLDLIFITSDRFLIASFLGISQVGYYSLGIMINGIYCIIPGTFASTINQRLIQNNSSNRNAESSILVTKSTLIMSILMLCFINVGIFLLPTLIDIFLQKYIQSKNIIIYFIFSSYFFSISNICIGHLISLNKEVFNLKSLIILVCCLITTNFLLLKNGYGIEIIAISTGIFYTLYGLIFIFNSFYLIYQSLKIVFFKIVKLAIPFILLIFLFYIENVFLQLHSIIVSISLFFLNFICLFSCIIIIYSKQKIIDIAISLNFK